MEVIFDFRLPTRFIPSERRNAFTVSDVDKDFTKIGSSDCNNYLPFSALITHSLMTVEKTVNGEVQKVTNILEYTRLKYSYSAVTRSYDNTFQSLKSMKYPVSFRSSSKGEDIQLTCTAGQITDETGKILLLTAVRKDKFPLIANKILGTGLESSPEFRLENVEAKDFLIIVGPELSREPKYRNFYRQLVISYLNPASNMGVDILNTTDVESWVFKNNFKMPSFRTIFQRQEYLKSLTKLI